MKYTVTVADQTFEVDIEDINARPVLARIDGQAFEVTPENPIDAPSPQQKREAASLPHGATSQHMSGNDMIAPLPGTITEIFAKPGQRVEPGQVLLVIEAMKMKNSIRSVKTGVIGEILVQPGQSVAHKQALIRFAGPGEAAWI